MTDAPPPPRARRKRIKSPDEDRTSEVASPPSSLPRRALAAGGTLIAVGLAMVGVGPSDPGMAVTLAGLVVTAYGVHAFGRLGPDEGSLSI